jgi:hypothetical protein
MTENEQDRSHGQDDGSYEPPAVSALGTVEDFTQGDSASIDGRV